MSRQRLGGCRGVSPWASPDKFASATQVILSGSRARQFPLS